MLKNQSFKIYFLSFIFLFLVQSENKSLNTFEIKEGEDPHVFRVKWLSIHDVFIISSIANEEECGYANLSHFSKNRINLQ